MPSARNTLRIGAAVVAAGGATALSLGSAGVLALPAWAIVAAVAGSAAGAVGTPVAESLRDRSADRRLRLETEVRQALRTAIVTAVADGPGWDATGATFYRVERAGRWPSRHERLVRFAYEHLQLALPTGKATWEKGDGALGECWAERGERTGTQNGEGVVAVVVEDGTTVLGVVSLNVPAADLRRVQTPSGEIAVRAAAKSVAKALSEAGVRGG